MVCMTEFQDESTADRIIAQLDRVNAKVDDMRNERLNDPDSMGDKLLKFALPSIAGFVAGKAFQLLWNKGTGAKLSEEDEAQQGLLMSVLFAALSAAFTASVSMLSDRGSKAFVARRHRKRAAR